MQKAMRRKQYILEIDSTSRWPQKKEEELN